VGLERGPLIIVSITEDLLGRKISGYGPEIRDYDRRGSDTLTTWHPYSQKLALSSPTSGGSSVGIVRSQSQTTEFSFSLES
jgi:hypothetical protein